MGSGLIVYESNEAMAVSHYVQTNLINTLLSLVCGMGEHLVPFMLCSYTFEADRT